MQMTPDIEFVLKIYPAPKGTIYLSVSWQPDLGKVFGYRLILSMDRQNYLVIGDTKGFSEMDSNRIRRIMDTADGFLSSLPFRPDKPSKTSSFMLDELKIALEAGLPIAILYDNRIGLQVNRSKSAAIVELIFSDASTVEIPATSLLLCEAFDFGVQESEELVLAKLLGFLPQASTPASKIVPYAFLITRLQPDFALPRAACIAASEHASGITCLWIDSQNYSTNVDDTIERVRLLIKHAAFVVAEISLTDENLPSDNPSRAHEIGLATAYRKKIFLVSHEPRRHPYHGLVSRQLVWWKDEKELYDNLFASIYSERGIVGRHIYNLEIEEPDRTGLSKSLSTEFDTKQAPAWTPPASHEISAAQSWIYALSFGLIAFCLALILRYGIGYEDTFDFASVLAGIVAILFSSRASKSIHSFLRRVGYMRWLVPLIAAMLLAATIIFFRPRAIGAGGKGVQPSVEQGVNK